MTYRFLLMGLLSGGLLVCCQSNKKAGGAGGAHLADNGGYSEGSFYGDTSAPAPAGYPRDGETFATSGGVPFGHNDTVDVGRHAEPAAPVWRKPAAAAVAAADPYGGAYGDGSSYSGDGGSERAVVTPYVERAQPVVAETTATPTRPKPTAKTASAGKTTSKTASKKAVVSAPSKKSPVVASSSRSGKGAVKAGGKKTGTTVKAVYTPGTKGKAAANKKAAVVRVHEVKRGDTLSKVASRYGVSVAQLKKRNKLAGDTIVVGKRLTID